MPTPLEMLMSLKDSEMTEEKIREIEAILRAQRGNFLKDESDKAAGVKPVKAAKSEKPVKQAKLSKDSAKNLTLADLLDTPF